jgi:hypothetical protein
LVACHFSSFGCILLDKAGPAYEQKIGATLTIISTRVYANTPREIEEGCPGLREGKEVEQIGSRGRYVSAGIGLLHIYGSWERRYVLLLVKRWWGRIYRAQEGPSRKSRGGFWE